MTQNDISRAIVAVLAPVFTGIAQVRQGFQPTTTNTPSTPLVFFTDIAHVRMGTLQRLEYWNGTTMVHEERQRMESTYQVNALSIQNPNTPNIPTAYDLVKLATDTLQSSVTITNLLAKDIQVLKITDIRSGYSIDDHGQYEQNPSADFILTYNTVKITSMPVIDEFTNTIIRI